MRNKHQLAIAGSSCRSERKLLTLLNEGKWIRLVGYHLFLSVWNSRGANWRYRISWKLLKAFRLLSILLILIPQQGTEKDTPSHSAKLKKPNNHHPKKPSRTLSWMALTKNSNISLMSRLVVSEGYDPTKYSVSLWATICTRWSTVHFLPRQKFHSRLWDEHTFYLSQVQRC